MEGFVVKHRMQAELLSYFFLPGLAHTAPQCSSARVVSLPKDIWQLLGTFEVVAPGGSGYCRHLVVGSNHRPALTIKTCQPSVSDALFKPFNSFWLVTDD
jgi:hypothetical protein